MSGWRWRMRDRWDHVWRSMNSSPIAWWIFGMSFLFILLSFITPIWLLSSKLEQGQSIPIHYNVYFGVDDFGSWEKIFLLPALGLIFFLLNFTFYIPLIIEHRFLALILMYGTLFIECVLLIAMGFILLMNR